MPNRQHTHQVKAADSTVGYSPRLCNEDLAPTRDQNWSWYNIFSFWMSDVHSKATWSRRASSRSGWPAGRCALPAGGNLYRPAVRQPGGEAEPDGGGPYAVICRQAFGVFGANIPAVIRGLIAFAWYGIQTYLAANALMLVLKFWPSLATLTAASLACRIWMALFRHHVAAAGDGFLAR
jgi:NCS1 family nucleobase:cation symporter-1